MISVPSRGSRAIGSSDRCGCAVKACQPRWPQQSLGDLSAEQSVETDAERRSERDELANRWLVGTVESAVDRRHRHARSACQLTAGESPCAHQVPEPVRQAVPRQVVKARDFPRAGSSRLTGRSLAGSQGSTAHQLQSVKLQACGSTARGPARRPAIGVPLAERGRGR